MKKTGAVLLLFASTALPVHAQEESEAGRSLSGLIQENSENCDFTFFTHSDDILDLRSDAETVCVDLLSGRDILALGKDDYPGGMTVYTGAGRDIVLLPDGDDVVITYDDEDEEILTRGGNDKVVMRGRLAEGQERPGRAPKTKVSMGTGDDRLEFGMPGSEGVVRLRSPDLEIRAGEWGKLDVDAYCGRHSDHRTVDLSFLENSARKSVSIDADGCGISLRRQSGPLRLRQVGSRLDLMVRPEFGAIYEFPAPLDVDVEKGASISASFESSSKDSVVNWQGFGFASLNFDLRSNEMGGKFDVESGGPLYATVDLAEGEVVANLRSGDEIEMVLAGAMTTSRMSFELAARQVRVHWYPEFGRFPSLRIADEAEVTRVSGKADAEEMGVRAAIDDWAIRDGMVIATKAGESSIFMSKKDRVSGDGDQSTSSDFGSEKPLLFDEMNEVEQAKSLYSAMASAVETRTEKVETDSVEFVIQRRMKDGSCLDVMMFDVDGVHDKIRIDCDDLISSVSASNYETVRVSSGGKTMSVAINGRSGFRVDRMSVKE